MQLTKLVATRKVDTSITAYCAQYVTRQKYFSHPSSSYNFFSNPTHKIEPGLQVVGTWKATNSNPLGPIKLSSQWEKINKYDLIVLLDRSWALKSVNISGFQQSPVDSLDSSDELHPKFPLRGHIQSNGGDALLRGINFWTYQLVLVLEFWKKSFQPIIDMGSF